MSEIEMMIKSIDDFGTECEDKEYTDTGDAWRLLNEARTVLARQLPRTDGSADYERDGLLGEVIDRRQQVYGDAVTGWSEVAALWSTYLGFTIQAHQAPIMMVLLKIQRSKTSPDYSDHVDDMEGYLDIFRKVIGPDMIEARSVTEYIEKKWPQMEIALGDLFGSPAGRAACICPPEGGRNITCAWHGGP